MKPLALLVPFATTFGLFAGCATTGTGVGHEDTSVSGSHLDLQSVPATDAKRVFPARVSKPLLPAADRLARQIAYEHGGSISTQVHLCVRPDGEIGDITLLMTSGMDDFDRAVVDGISDWQYAAFKAPAATRVCENLTVSYVTR